MVGSGVTVNDNSGEQTVLSFKKRSDIRRHKVGSAVSVNDNSGEQTVISFKKRSDIRSEAA